MRANSVAVISWLTAVLVAHPALARLSITCPTVSIYEKLQSGPPPGFVLPQPGGLMDYQNPMSDSAEFFEFFLNNPAQRQVILPDFSDIDYYQAGHVAWHFGKGQAIWLGCHYGQIMLIRPLPPGTTSCRYSISKNGDQAPISCR